MLLNLLILTILYFICLSAQLIPLSTVWNNIGLDENYVGDQTKDKGKAEPLPSKRWQAILRTQSGIIVQSLIGPLQEKSIRSRLVYVPCYSQGYASYKARNARTRLCRWTEAENSWLLVWYRRRALKTDPCGPDGLKILKCNSRKILCLRVLVTRRILEIDCILLLSGTLISTERWITQMLM